MLAAVGAMGPEAAAESQSQTDVKHLTDSIVVTANRVGIAARETVWPVKVIKTSQLSGDSEISAVLDGQAGLDTRSHGGFGSLSTVANWGLFARHLLLVYNGRVVRDYSLGGFNLSDFSAAEIDRIEILKGPQSAFYGADAVGGVINLVSAGALANRANLSIRQGSHGFQHYLVDLSRRLGNAGIAGYAEFSKSDNHRHNAGVERTAFGLRSDYLSPDGKHHVFVSARYFDDSLGVPGPDPAAEFIPVYGDDESWSLFDHQKDENYSADMQYRMTDERIGQIQLDLFWEKKNLDYHSLYNYQFAYYIHDYSIDPPDSVFAVDSVDVLSNAIYSKRSAGACGRYSKAIGPIQAALGLDFLSGSVRATTSDRNTAVNVAGPYAPFEYSYDTYNFWKGSQNQIDIWSNSILRLDEWSRLDLSGRLQFVKGRQTQPSYNAGLIISSSESWQAKIGYAYAYRLPTIAERFAEDVFTAGNEDLHPEVSRSVIGTLDLNLPEQGLSSRLTVFHQRVDSLVRYLLDWNTFLYVPQNVDRFKATGIDLAVETRLVSELTIGFSSVFQKARQTPPDGEDFVDAFYVPDIKWRADVSGVYRKLAYALNLNYTSDRSTLIGGQTKSIDKVYELGLQVSVSVSRQFSVSVVGYDLTDEARPDQFGFTMDDSDYPTPGRRFVLGIRYSVF